MKEVARKPSHRSEPVRTDAEGKATASRPAVGLPSSLEQVIANRAHPSITSPGDAVERQADRMAIRAMGTSRTNAATLPLPETTRARRSTLPPSVSDTIASPGRPLDPRANDYFRPRFGYDFSSVRVHDDARANASARSIRARAYTVDNHVVLGRGQGDFTSRDGKHLLGHELAHVTQNATGSTQPNLVMRDPEERSWWQRARDTAYDWLIDGMRSAQRAAEQQLVQLGVPQPLVRAFSGVSEMLIRLSLGVIGMISGFGAGIVQAVVGLLRLLWGVTNGLASLILSIVTGDAHYIDEWLTNLGNALRNLIPALRQLIDSWLQEFSQASEDRQTIMIGELTGQVLAVIATAGFTAGRAGQAASAAGELSVTFQFARPATAFAHGGVRAPATVGARIPAQVTTAVAAGGTGTTMAMSSINEGSRSGGGGGSGGGSGRGSGNGNRDPFADWEEVYAQERARGGTTNRNPVNEEIGFHERARLPRSSQQPAPFRRGNFAHTYGDDIIPELPRGTQAEVSVWVRESASRIRIDRVDWQNGVIYEIRPNNPHWVRQMEVNMPDRVAAMNAMHPRVGGWTGRVVTYSETQARNMLIRAGATAEEAQAVMAVYGF